MLEPLYTAAEMRDAEAGHDSAELRERAGRAVADRACELFLDARSYTVICGGGSNGADGRIAARALEAAGREVRVVDARADSAATELGEPDVVVDALFGTGFHGESRPGAARLIDAINALGVPVLSIDLPSGVDASTGEIAGAAVGATATVTLHGRKVGLEVAPGRFRAGAVYLADIGLDHRETVHRVVSRRILALVPRRGAKDTKYSAGSLLVIGGSRGLSGAVCLAAKAAFRADAGYVAVAVPQSVLPVVELSVLEAVKRALPEDAGGGLDLSSLEVLQELAGRAKAVALGPGLGRGAATHELVGRLLQEIELPMVVDADALHALAPADWPAARVLTPHAGELAQLLARDSGWVDAHRLAAVTEAAERFDCVVVLKGADTLVAAPGHGVLVCSLGLPSLATAGSGDVLTGVVGAFLAKGMEPRLAAAAAATAHAVASIEAPQRAGLLASDLIGALPRALA